MAGESFERARRLVPLGHPSAWPVYALSGLAAALLATLLWLLCQITHVLAGADRGAATGSEFAVDSPAGPTAGTPARHPLGWRLARRLAERVAGQPTPQSPGFGPQHRFLLALLATGLLLSGAYAATQFALERAVQAAASAAVVRLRGDLFRQHVRLQGVDLSSRRQPSAAELFDERVETIREGLVCWWRAVPYACAFVPVLLLLALSAQLWLTIVAVLVICLDSLLLARWDREARRRLALASDRVAQQAKVALGRLRLVALGRVTTAALAEEPIETTLDRWEHSVQARRDGESFVMSVRLFVVAATIALLTALAGVNVLRTPPSATVAETLLLTVSLACLADPVWRLFRLRATSLRADRAARAVFAYLELRPLVTEVERPTKLAPLTREVEFEGVTLVDPSGAPLLDNVSFKIPVHLRVAVISTHPRTMSGLAGLLSRWYDPTAGHVRIDGVDLRQVSQDSLRREVHALFCHKLIFPGSALENITCGDAHLSDAEASDAARRAHVLELLQRLPGGMQTSLVDLGSRLDRNDAYRIGLARLFLRPASLLIVQEPTWEVDARLAESFDNAWQQLARQRTMIVFPTRLVSLRTAERVLVFHEGRLMAQGTHASLLETSDLYRHLNYLRFNTFRGVQPA